jgi:hypothetical protein
MGYDKPDLIKKRDILDPLEDDDDIDWKHNPFDVDLTDDERESFIFTSTCYYISKSSPQHCL